MPKKFISIVLSLCLLAVAFSPNLAFASKSDYDNHWAVDSIDYLLMKGIVVGYDNDNPETEFSSIVKPDNFITRAEFVTIINKAFNYTEATGSNFPDVLDEAWYSNDFKIAKTAGYLKGDQSGLANPTSNITRAEVCTILYQVLGLTEKDVAANTFSDGSAIPVWSLNAVLALSGKGVVNGYPDNSFRASNSITRAESFVIICNALNLEEEVGAEPTEPPVPAKPNESEANTTTTPAADSKLTLKEANITITVNGSKQITAEGYQAKDLTFTSENKDIATVDSEGLVRGQKEGTTTITVSAENGAKKATCTVKVEAKTSSGGGGGGSSSNGNSNTDITNPIILKNTEIYLAVGEIEQLSAENYEAKSLNFFSDDVKVATVDEVGLIQAISSGTTTITVKTKTGNKEASCLVTVLKPVVKEGISEIKMKGSLDSVEVDYKLEQGTGAVRILEAEESNPINTTVGAIGSGVDIVVDGDSVESATIRFRYNPDELNGIAEEDLGIAWYDAEDSDCMVLLEDSTVNLDDNCVEVQTEHFSEYILVDKKSWLEQWSKEQLVPRNIDEEGNPEYYFNVAFILDVSGSMSSRDIILAKDATNVFIDNLSDGDMVSIMYFSSNSDYIIKSEILGADNRQTVRDTINNYQTNGGGTNIQSGLDKAMESMSNMELNRVYDNQESKSFAILLSDGEDGYWGAENENFIQYMSNYPNKVFTVGIGGADEKLMQEIAQRTNGAYSYGQTSADILNIFDYINRNYIDFEDSDGDGIANSIETSGMRNQYGVFIKTDPNNPDTDGDGISDGEEMGELINKDYQACFRMISNPTLYTTVLEPKVKTMQFGLPVYTDSEGSGSFAIDLYIDFASYGVEQSNQKDYRYKTPDKVTLISQPYCSNCLSYNVNYVSKTNIKIENVKCNNWGSLGLFSGNGCKSGNKEHIIQVEVIMDGLITNAFSNQLKLDFAGARIAAEKEQKDNIVKFAEESEEFLEKLSAQMEANCAKEMEKQTRDLIQVNSLYLGDKEADKAENVLVKWISQKYINQMETSALKGNSAKPIDIVNAVGKDITSWLGDKKDTITVDNIEYEINIKADLLATVKKNSGNSQAYQFVITPNPYSTELEKIINNYLNTLNEVGYQSIENAKKAAVKAMAKATAAAAKDLITNMDNVMAAKAIQKQASQDKQIKQMFDELKKIRSIIKI